MMHGREKSDLVVVAVKPTNKAEQSAAEPAEPRTGTKGSAGQQSTPRDTRRPGTTPKHRPVASGCAYRRAGKFHPMPPTDSGRADLALAAVTKAGIAVAVELGVGHEILVGRIAGAGCGLLAFLLRGAFG
jgi:hypothetical protein